MQTLEKTANKIEVGRNGILDAAARLFRENGYSAVSLRSIAKASGIKAASIYYHFPSKDAIVVEILDAGIVAVHEQVRTSISALPPNPGSEEILRAGIRGHLAALLEHGDYTSANVRIFGQVPKVVRKANYQTRRRYEALWDTIISDLKASGALRPEVDETTFRLMLIGALNATLEWFNPGKGKMDDLADNYTDIFLNGILQKTEGVA